MKVFVGIDVSKLKLDVAVLGSSKGVVNLQVPNTPVGSRDLLAKVRRLASGAPLHFCMEVTGSYHYELALFLVQEGEVVSVENPRRVKHFAVAMGATQKTDRADAKVIASYAQTINPAPWKLAEPHIRELVALDRRITELKNLTTQESNRLETPCLPKLVAQGIEQSVQAFQRQIQELETRIRQILSENEELDRQVKLLQTIPGIAERSAVGLLAEIGDIRNYDSAQDLAAKFGLNPVVRRSGTSLKAKTCISKQGNAHARARLYMPTLTAIRINRPIRDFYTKLVLNHKPKKAALIAAERKLVMICYGVLKSGKPFDENHAELTS